MSLRRIATNDLKTIHTDSVTGFGWPITITAPNAGAVYNITGRNNDIHLAIDPDTGNLVSDRTVSITFVTSLIPETIKAISKGAPWVVTVDNINGVTGVFKVVSSIPDGVLGLTVLMLEAYRV